MSQPQVTIRVLSEHDSIQALTALLHRAYARLGDMGLNYTAVDQSPEVTVERISRGTCYVAFIGSQLVGTILVRPTHIDSECPHYNRSGVSSVHQLAVAPEFQSAGIGSDLLSCAEAWARENGFNELAMDTAEPATHLIEYYERRGYHRVGSVQWPGKTYRSVVLSKVLKAQPDIL